MNEKLLPKLKVTDKLDLRTLETNVTLQFLDEKIKLREALVEDRVKKLLRQ